MKLRNLHIVQSVLAAVTTTVVYALAIHINEVKLQLLVMAVIAVVTFFGYGVVIKHHKSKLFYGLCAGVVAVLAAVWVIVPVVTALSAPGLYDNFDNLETDFFSEKNVLVLVPHQDDELNLAGGLMEQYTARGSNVSVAFCTNGDYRGIPEQRFREALEVTKQCGVPEENVYFLGFGDDWTTIFYEGNYIKHVYNSPAADMVWTSHYGATATYGTAVKDCYLQLPYTREAYLESMKRLIQEIRPDTIYVNDTDAHIDHKAVSYFFEEVMGQMLKEDGSYRPTVYKGYCYPTAWVAPNDFSENINILSTQEPGEMHPDTTWKSYYRWDRRLRLPMSNAGLHRLLSETKMYDLLLLYDSQLANRQAGCMTNGDKVVWERNTNSLLYNADITVGGTAQPMLHDFKLLDDSYLPDWVADLGVVDVSGGVTVTLPQRETLLQIGLYDDPDESCNILAGYIELDNGTRVNFGPLEKNGALTYVDIPETDVGGFTLMVTEFEGAVPGLMEIEAYDAVQVAEGDLYLMLMDEGENFVYDYLVTGEDDRVMLSLYSHPRQVSLADVTIQMNGDEGCSYEVAGEVLTIHCPEGQSCMVEVSYEDVSCKAKFTNESPMKRAFVHGLQMVDHKFACDEQHSLTWRGQVIYYTRLVERFFVKLANII